MKMRSNLYDTLKWLALIVMPALALLVKTIGESIQWSYTDVCVTIINAVAVFLGAILGKSAVDYHRNAKGDADK